MDGEYRLERSSGLLGGRLVDLKKCLAGPDRQLLKVGGLIQIRCRFPWEVGRALFQFVADSKGRGVWRTRRSRVFVVLTSA